MGQAGLRQTFVVINRRNGGNKKSSPGDGNARFNESLRHLSAVLIAGVERGIGNENISGAGVLQFAGVSCYFARFIKAHFAAFDVRIRAVTAFKGAPSFGLQIQHAAVSKIKARVRSLRIKMPADFSVKRLINNFCFFFRQDTGYFSDILIFFQGFQQKSQPFALADYAIIGIECLHELNGENRKAAAAQDYFCF